MNIKRRGKAGLLLLSACFVLNSKAENLNLDELSFKLTSTWHDFGHYKTCQEDVYEQYALKKLITFRSKKALKLNSLKLRWIGGRLPSISSALYKKKEKERLLMIEQNVVSDGVWNTKKQEVLFALNEKLFALNKYYLIVSFPSRFEKTVKQGRFIAVLAK